MFHMLSRFNLPPDEDISSFCGRYRAFAEQMQRLDLLVEAGPIGCRQRDTPMDTDAGRDHQYFSIMTFRDRAQVDAAYAHILAHIGPADDAHNHVYTRVADPVFTCWQDLDADPYSHSTGN